MRLVINDRITINVDRAPSCTIVCVGGEAVSGIARMNISCDAESAPREIVFLKSDQEIPSPVVLEAFQDAGFTIWFKEKAK